LKSEFRFLLESHDQPWNWGGRSEIMPNNQKQRDRESVSVD
jgi:hypothetical protein